MESAEMNNMANTESELRSSETNTSTDEGKYYFIIFYAI